MRGVICNIPQHILDWRARTGADQWDEMWEGVLHMPPMPNREHQDFQWEMETWLRTFWAERRGNRVHHQINLASIGGWPDDYRIPDLLLLTPDRFHIDHNEYFEGAPLVVVEIRSPGDETYEKMTFYAGLGAAEMWVIDRDTKAPELYVLVEGRYQQQSADEEGWVTSRATDVQLRGEATDQLAMRIIDDPASTRLLPPR